MGQFGDYTGRGREIASSIDDCQVRCRRVDVKVTTLFIEIQNKG